MKKNGGTNYVFSSMHPSGQKLNHLGKIACILHYSIEIDVQSDSEEEE